MRLRNIQRLQAAAIDAKIITYSGHDHRLTADCFQVVGNVAGTAAKLAAHFRHQKRHIQHVHLVRQNVVLEMIMEHHDRVVGH